MLRRLAALMIVAVAAASCSPSDGHPVVFAAASLTDAFTELAGAFEAAEGIEVTLSFGASSSLRDQILAGAPADVFASASRPEMDALAAAGVLAGEPVGFATNTMVVAVPPGNPGEVAALDDLGDPSLLIGLCSPEVPCGSLARAILEDAGVVPAVDTEEPNVAALHTKIATGELDAGMVYATDRVGGDVEVIEVPDAARFVAVYPIAALDGAGEEAGAFVDFVLSTEGQEILAGHGFGAP